MNVLISIVDLFEYGVECWLYYLVYVDGGGILIYDQFVCVVWCVVVVFVVCGVQFGECVVIYVLKCVEIVVVMLVVNVFGVIFVLVNLQLKEVQIEYIVVDSGVVLFVIGV